VSCIVPDVSAVTMLGSCPAPTALVKSIVKVPYDEWRCKSAVAELELRLTRGPDAKRKLAAVFVGSIEPPFHDLQLWHSTLAVIVPFEIPLPGPTVYVTFDVYDGSVLSWESRGLIVTFVAVESAYIINIKVFFILLLPIPTD